MQVQASKTRNKFS